MSEAEQGTTSTGTGGKSATFDSICDGIRKGFDAIFDAVTPPEQAVNHFREAQIEVWRGIRAIIDYRIERLSRSGAQGARVVVE